MPINEVSITRRRTDVSKLRELQNRMPRTLSIIGINGDPARLINLRISIPTVKNNSYPQNKQEFSEVEISLPENYPFPPGPFVMFKTPIWNPNVYESGKWCFGDWKITENLELFVMRLIKVIALDPTIINPHSAANAEAARWYANQLRINPKLFPTVNVSNLVDIPQQPSITWRPIK